MIRAASGWMFLDSYTTKHYQTGLFEECLFLKKPTNQTSGQVKPMVCSMGIMALKFYYSVTYKF